MAWNIKFIDNDEIIISPLHFVHYKWWHNDIYLWIISIISNTCATYEQLKYGRKQKGIPATQSRPPTAHKIVVPLWLRDERSYADVLISDETMKPKDNHQTLLSDDFLNLDHNLNYELIIHDYHDFDIEWLRNSLVRWISEGRDYRQIQQ